MNVKFFDTWSSDMAYILGFIMADGHISHQDYCNAKGFKLSINLQLNDIEILKFIKSKLNCNDIYIRKWIASDNIYREQCSLIISSKYIIERLMQLGVVPKKTGKEVFPLDIPKEFEHDFIRGYFDGDGCIMITTQIKNNKEYPVCMFKITCANKLFLETCKQKLSAIHNNVRYHGNNCYILETRNRTDMIKVRDYLYNTDSFALHRKKHKFFSIPTPKR